MPYDAFLSILCTDNVDENKGNLIFYKCSYAHLIESFTLKVGVYTIFS